MLGLIAWFSLLALGWASYWTIKNVAPKTILIVAIPLIGLTGLYFADNIKGYYRFKELCATQGGLRKYQPLAKGVGWLEPEEQSLKNAGSEQVAPMANFPEMGFVRFQNKDDGLWYDEYRVKDSSTGKTTFIKKPADLGKSVVYQRRYLHKSMPNEFFTSLTEIQFINLENNTVVASYKDFGNKLFDPQKTMFTFNETCSDSDDDKQLKIVSIFTQ